MVDSLERHYPHIFAIPILGPFIKGGFCATAAWILVWPFENLKVGADIRAAMQGGAETTFVHLLPHCCRATEEEPLVR